MIILEAICQALANDTAVLLQRSPENNEKTLLALSSIGYNSQALLNSGRLVQASNANYFEVSAIFYGTNLCSIFLYRSVPPWLRKCYKNYVHNPGAIVL